MEWQIYHLKHKPEPDETTKTKDRHTETEKLQTVIEDQKTEIARLKKLFRNAGIDPNSDPNKPAKLRTEREEKKYQKRLAAYRDYFKEEKSYKPKPKVSPFPQSTDSGSDSYKRTPANRNWYEGGTLHRAGVLAWQESADYKNKLATCADFIATPWLNENFKPLIHNKIKTIDDMRPYAAELVICLDAATEKHPDPETNYNMYANQTVADMATMCMIMMGWMR